MDSKNLIHCTQEKPLYPRQPPLKIDVYFAKRLIDAPYSAVMCAMEGDLAIRFQHSHVWPFLTGEEMIAWAEMDLGSRVVVGCEVLSRKQEGRVWWAEVGYVREDFRGRGVMTAIKRRIRDEAQVDGKVRFIESLVAADNKAMIQNMERDGVHVANYHYRYAVGR